MSDCVPDFGGKFFAEARPVAGKKYFPRADSGVRGAVLICLYNEEATDLSRTLESLAVGAPLDIVVVADGLDKLSRSIREYFLSFFGLDEAILEDSTYDQKSHLDGTVHHQVFISNRIPVGQEGTRVSVLLKRNNQKKINSHEWFFKAHAPNTGCPFGLTTDVGTMFRRGTVEKLLSHLTTHEQCAAITAHHKVMSEYNHRVLGRTTPERDTLLDWVMRSWQGCDYELGAFGEKGADCAGGLTVCLHGPCAMFRLEDIQGTCLDEYFDEWGYAPLHTLSIVGANLQLGEDRILSFLSATHSTKYITSLFDAAFEVDPELSLKSLVTQRRRWRNATAAGTYYMLTQIPSIIHSSYSLSFKLSNMLLLGCKAFETFCSFFTPACWGISFITLFGFLGGLIGPTSQLCAETVQGTLYSVLYTVFVYVHLKRKDGDCVFQPALFKFMFIYGTTMAIIGFGVLLHGITSGRINPGSVKVLMMPIAVPFISALLGGYFEAFLSMLRYWLIYFVTGPFQSFCLSYSSARLADVSWGNRPTEAAGHKDNAKNLEEETHRMQQWAERQMSRCALFNMFLVCLNIGVMVAMKVMLPRWLSRWAPTYSEVDALPLVFMFFGAGRILQLMLAFGYHLCQWMPRRTSPTGNPYTTIEQAAASIGRVSPMSP
jgi:cellulose synthase/poly-beta-1,6-N-acetylglucosamine synthase-like glycosyltransferase